MNPKVLAYIPLYYGAEYLEACIKAIEPVTDRIMIIYVPQGSQGHRVQVQCPETEEQLKAIALAASPKVEWHKDNFPNEGAHRNWINRHTDGYDVLITADADEVFDTEDLKRAINEVFHGEHYAYGVDGFINFWRSFNHVCFDGFRPYRFFNLHRDRNSRGEVKCKIYHFGCCQSEAIVRFKWHVSGHKNELRQGWIDNIYLAWRPGMVVEKGLHCVAYDLWNAAEYDKNTLPEVLKNHPNFNKERV